MEFLNPQCVMCASKGDHLKSKLCAARGSSITMLAASQNLRQSILKKTF
jgi:hypothetical protein